MRSTTTLPILSVSRRHLPTSSIARHYHSKTTSCVGIFRDHCGNWIFGFTRNFGMTNVLCFELWGISSVLKLTWQNGFRNLILEFDSLVVVNLILSDANASHLY
ncbi:putative ribonuclease H protein [Glycine soja]